MKNCTIKKITISILAFVLFSIQLSLAGDIINPVSPNASPEAKALLNFYTAYLVNTR